MSCPWPLSLPGKGIYSHTQEPFRAVRFYLMRAISLSCSQCRWILLHCTLVSVHNLQHISWELASVSWVWGSPTLWQFSCLPYSISHKLSCRLTLWGSNDRSPQPETARSGEETPFTAVQKPEGFVAWKDRFSCIHFFYAIPSFMLWSVCHSQWITRRQSN